jgi:diguanylate cyclase (GGDEF)-like protein
MSSQKIVVIISRDVVLANIIERILKDSYMVVIFTSLQSSLDYIYNSIPDMLVMELEGDDATLNVLREMKEDPIFGQVPVLAVFADNYAPYWEQMPVDDYLRRSCLEADMHLRVDLCIQRSERVVETNPLTRLPGNIAIIKQIQKRLDAGEIFALAYADLDYFKPFNDKYGFSRGDEVLKMLGRLIMNTVKARQPHGSFVGHIGGDDFVFITEAEHAEETAAEIIENFKRIIPTFYDSDDRAKGHIESVDREGLKRIFPMIGLSIGMAHNKAKKFSHYGEMAEVASEMKKYAKCAGGACCKIDQRQPD